MNKTLLTLALISSSTEAFAPVAVAPKNSATQTTQLNAKTTGGDIAKAALASALSFSLLFGPTPAALADGKFFLGKKEV